MVNIEVNNVSDLELLSDFLNDSDMDIDTFSYDPSAREIRVAFEKESWSDREPLGGSIFRRFRVPVLKYVLKISNVERYELIDTEQIARYDVCEVIFNKPDKRITFTTGVPLHFSVNVSTLELQLKRSPDEPKYLERRRLWFLAGPLGIYRKSNINV